MKMVNMAMKAEEKGKSDGCCCCGPCDCESDRPRFPWGLQICLEDEQMKALGISSMPGTGKTMTMTAVVKVTRCSEDEMEGEEPRRSMSLQITDMALEMPMEKRKAVDMSSAAAEIYRKPEA